LSIDTIDESKNSTAPLEFNKSESHFTKSHGLFATTINSQQPSVTCETQQAANDKIKNQEQKAEKKLNRKKNLPQIPSSPNDNEAKVTVLDKNEGAEVEKVWRTIYFKSENSAEMITSQVYRLPGTHLFICCDVDHIPYADKTTVDELQKIVKLGKIITRDSYNQSGLKIYGRTLAAAKSCNKTASHGFRLILLPYEIQHEKHVFYVYRPEKIVSHDDYVKLIKNKKKIESMTQLAQKSLVASFTAADSTPSYRPKK